MNDAVGDDRMTIRLMNDYGVTIPLWDHEGQTDGEELGLSDALRSDLTSFAQRWERSIPDEVFDDRFDGVPVMGSLVVGWHRLRRLAHGSGRRATEAEDAALRILGEDLRSRLQHELGSSYRVTYQH
jgi:hypothetical protein